MRLYNTKWNGNAPILSCHIPKAMGSWLRKELMFNLGPERNFKPIATFDGTQNNERVWELLFDKGVDQFCLIEGHFIFDQRALGISERCFVVTSIREPVDMFWSLAKYIAKRNNSISSLTDVVLTQPYLFDNVVCRYLSGFSPQRIINSNEFDEIIPAIKNNVINYFDFIFIDKYLEQCCMFFNQISKMEIKSDQKINTADVNEWFFAKSLFRDVVFEEFDLFFKYDLLIYKWIVDCFIGIAKRKILGVLPFYLTLLESIPYSSLSSDE